MVMSGDEVASLRSCPSTSSASASASATTTVTVTVTVYLRCLVSVQTRVPPPTRTIKHIGKHVERDRETPSHRCRCPSCIAFALYPYTTVIYVVYSVYVRNAMRYMYRVSFFPPLFFSFYSFGMHHRTVARDAPEAACGCLICRAKTLGCARTELLIPEMELGPGHLLEANTYSTGRPSRMQHLATAISIVRRQNWGQAIEHVSLSTQVGRCQMDASTPIRR